MSKQVKIWAKKARQELLFAFFNQCCHCGEGDINQLEFDCIIPQGHKHHTGSTDQRICFYRKQKQNKNLQLLCSTCHQVKTDKDNNEPF